MIDCTSDKLTFAITWGLEQRSVPVWLPTTVGVSAALYGPILDLLDFLFDSLFVTTMNLNVPLLTVPMDHGGAPNVNPSPKKGRYINCICVDTVKE